MLWLIFLKNTVVQEKYQLTGTELVVFEHGCVVIGSEKKHLFLLKIFFLNLNRDQSDPHANSMAVFVVMIQSPRSYVITRLVNLVYIIL